MAQSLARGTPVELCITSNVITDSIHGRNSNGNRNGIGNSDGDVVAAAAAAAKHHLGLMHAAGHPICICTDDPGIFSTTLSREYALAAVSLVRRGKGGKGGDFKDKTFYLPCASTAVQQFF